LNTRWQLRHRLALDEIAKKVAGLEVDVEVGEGEVSEEVD
jgi:DNA-directed RNA polymerase delta subunit